MFTPSELLDRLGERADPCEPITAPEVADLLDVSAPTARGRLNALVDAGELATKKVGGRARVYWIPNARP